MKFTKNFVLKLLPAGSRGIGHDDLHECLTQSLVCWPYRAVSSRWVEKADLWGICRSIQELGNATRSSLV